MDLSYILNELGEERENYFNAISPPIAQTSNFAFKKVADLSKAFEDEMQAELLKIWAKAQKTVLFSIVVQQPFLPAFLRM